MSLGEVIRKYRKELNMTQEEMAEKLGVTPPAVNKWEKGVSMPDIMLLAPIARLLGITLETLLSFKEELTDDEIKKIVCEIDSRFKNKTFEETFEDLKSYIEEYPNCLRLKWNLALIMDCRYVLNNNDNEIYEKFIKKQFEDVINGDDLSLKIKAAESLFNFYIRKQMYKEAENCLDYFSIENPERKRKQAFIYSKTGRKYEAFKEYEEIILSSYQILSLVFNSMYIMSIENNDFEKARFYVEKQCQSAKFFDMGRYNEIASRLDLAVAEKDEEATINIMEKLIEYSSELESFCKSPLYEHIEFKDVDEDFSEMIKSSLIKFFENEYEFSFLKENKKWHEIIDRNKK